MRHPPCAGPERHQLHAADPVAPRRAGGAGERHRDRAGRESRIDRALRHRAANARVGLRARSAARRADARRPSRCPAAASSATGRSICTCKGFEALGAAIRVENGNVQMFAPKLKGTVINLRGKFGPTVLGTDNVMMAAVLAEGTTVIEGAAAEPEVVRSREFPQQDGREDRRRGHAAHDHRRREGTARRGARHHSRPHRGRHLPRRGRRSPARA